MAARRKNNKRRKTRGRFGILYQLVSFLIILVVIAAGCVVFFRVADVTVTGQTQYSAQEIIDVAGILPGDNLFTINKVQVAKKILTELPYIDQVAIRRAFPDGVILTVSECRPTLVVEGGDGWWVADGKGKILEQTTQSTYPGAATVKGIAALTPALGTKLAVAPEQADKHQTLMDLTAAFTQQGIMDKVSSINLTETVSLTLYYENRFIVKLPMNCADFSRKARGLEKTVSALQSNEKGTIDMTREDEYYANVN